MLLKFTIRHSKTLSWLEDTLNSFIQEHHYIVEYKILNSWLYGPNTTVFFTLKNEEDAKLFSNNFKKIITQYLEKNKDQFQIHHNTQGFRFFPLNTSTHSIINNDDIPTFTHFFSFSNNAKNQKILEINKLYQNFITSSVENKLFENEDASTISIKLNALLTYYIQSEISNCKEVFNKAYTSFIADFKTYNYDQVNKNVEDIFLKRNDLYKDLYKPQSEAINSFIEFIISAKQEDSIDDEILMKYDSVLASIKKLLKEDFSVEEKSNFFSQFIRLNNHMASNFDDQDGLLIYFLLQYSYLLSEAI